MKEKISPREVSNSRWSTHTSRTTFVVLKMLISLLNTCKVACLIYMAVSLVENKRNEVFFGAFLLGILVVAGWFVFLIYKKLVT